VSITQPELVSIASDALVWCLEHFKTLDESNAAIHCAPVRYSPITFRVAGALDVLHVHLDTVEAVLAHRGVYAEDPGR